MSQTNINLNLLKALHALLEEKSVSKAGIRLGLTQSAVSLALRQLRAIYQDELLTRGSHHQMVLTTFAKGLQAEVREALRIAEKVFIEKAGFDPATSTRTFHIGMSDYIAFLLLANLMQKVVEQAPKIKIVQHAVNYLGGIDNFYESGMDMIIGDFAKAPPGLKVTHLFTDRRVVVADKNHPAFASGKLTLKKLIQYPQVFIALQNQPEYSLHIELLQNMGCQFQVSLMTPYALIVLQTLPNTLLMTNTSEKLSQPFLTPLGLAAHKTPYSVPPFRGNLYWHPRDQTDPGHIWLRNLIKSVNK